MDTTIRRNENCIIGLPQCDYVFSSTRSCFIGYGFSESSMEMEIIRNILEKRGIQVEEAGGTFAPGQFAFCSKICSKIITSQFCIILLNNDTLDGNETPNANVNMEYGLMLGFNKYVIPFQKENQKLPFNVAGLDTKKYTSKNISTLAEDAIDQAILETQQESTTVIHPNPDLETFLIMRGALVTPLNSSGDQDIFDMGKPLGFALLNDFSYMNYFFLGNFTSLPLEIVVWRANMLMKIIEQRVSTIDDRVYAGIVSTEQASIAHKIFNNLQIWLIVTSVEEKENAENLLRNKKYKFHIFSLDDVVSELESQGDMEVIP